ncbi:MAG TPA: hypothetical protein ENK97_03805, partial [Campylobacteraceae bacterium]|nr:hypothetical protein [Campylobacteraceae bacterium]
MKYLIFPLLIVCMLTPLAAASAPKLQLLYVEMEHCPWCQKIEQEVFSDTVILKSLRKHYTIKKLERAHAKLPLNLKP